MSLNSIVKSNALGTKYETIQPIYLIFISIFKYQRSLLPFFVGLFVAGRCILELSEVVSLFG